MTRSYLATFTRDDTIMNARRFVAAHFARNHFNVGCKKATFSQLYDRILQSPEDASLQVYFFTYLLT